MESIKADSANWVLAGSDQALYSLLFFIPGIVKSYCYRFVLYLSADEPDLNSYQIFGTFQGNNAGDQVGFVCAGYFLLFMVFIRGLTFNISTCFIRSYFNQADAECYLEVRNQ